MLTMPTISLNPQPAPFAVLIHEIKNPLCVITLACDMLNADGLDAEQKKYLEILKNAAMKISREVNALMIHDN